VKVMLFWLAEMLEALQGPAVRDDG